MKKYQLMWETLRKVLKESINTVPLELPFNMTIEVISDAMDEIELDYLVVDTKHILDNYKTYKTQVQYYRKTGALPSTKIGSRCEFFLKDVRKWAKERGIKKV